jgi:hypothetical protein
MASSRLPSRYANLDFSLDYVALVTITIRPNYLISAEIALVTGRQIKDDYAGWLASEFPVAFPFEATVSDFYLDLKEAKAYRDDLRKMYAHDHSLITERSKILLYGLKTKIVAWTVRDIVYLQDMIGGPALAKKISYEMILEAGLESELRPAKLSLLTRFVRSSLANVSRDISALYQDGYFIHRLYTSNGWREIEERAERVRERDLLHFSSLSIAGQLGITRDEMFEDVFEGMMS